MIQSYNEMSKRTKIITVIMLVLVFVLIFFPLRTLLAWLSWPFPIEYRDAASLDAAIAIHNGINIYSVDAYPEHVYVYGGLYPLLASCFLSFIRPSFRILYGIDLLFLIGILIVFGNVIRKKIKQKPLRFCLFLFAIFVEIVFAVLNFKISGTRPSLPGLFFMLLAVCSADHLNYSKKGLMLNWLFSFLAFNFKQYFLIGFPLVCLHVFLFRSKKKGLLFGISGLIAFFLAMALITVYFPLYPNCTLFHHIALTAKYNFVWMLHQLIPFLILLWLGFCVIAMAVKVHIKKNQYTFHIRSFQQPLIACDSMEQNGDIYLTGFIVLFLLFVFSMGGHWGNEYTYFIDLSLPFLLLAMAVELPVLLDSISALDLAQGFQFCGTILSIAVISLSQKYEIQHAYVAGSAILLLGLLLLVLLEKRFSGFELILLGLIYSIGMIFGFQHSLFITKADLPFSDYAAFNQDLSACESVYLLPSGYSYKLTTDNVTFADYGMLLYADTLIYDEHKPFAELFADQSKALNEKKDAYFSELSKNFTGHAFDCVTASKIDFIHDETRFEDFYKPVSQYSLTTDEAAILYR